MRRCGHGGNREIRPYNRPLWRIRLHRRLRATPSLRSPINPHSGSTLIPKCHFRLKVYFHTYRWCAVQDLDEKRRKRSDKNGRSRGWRQAHIFPRVDMAQANRLPDCCRQRRFATEYALYTCISVHHFWIHIVSFFLFASLRRLILFVFK